MDDGSREGALLAAITQRIREMSEEQHELARRQRILTHAATQLRLGWAATVVLAEVGAQSPDLVLDGFDPEPRPAASSSVRPLRRVTGHGRE